MLRAKRRRTRMHDSKGNPIFNTNNASVKENKYVMVNNNFCTNPYSGCVCLNSKYKKNLFEIINFPLSEFDGIYKESEPKFNGIPTSIGYVGLPIEAYKSNNNYFLQLHPIINTQDVVWLGYSGFNNSSVPLLLSVPFNNTSPSWKSLSIITQWTILPASSTSQYNNIIFIELKQQNKCKNKININPILGYRKQLVTKHNNQNTKAIQLSLNLTDKSIINLLKQVGLDYFNEKINFSGDYELVNHIEKESNLKDMKFNLAYKKVNTKNKNNNYEIGYFYEKNPIGDFSFNGWVLRYYNNVANPNIFIDYFYFVDDSDTNRLFFNALDNFSRTIFVLRTKNDDDNKHLDKGFFCFIDQIVVIEINNNDEIILKRYSHK